MHLVTSHRERVSHQRSASLRAVKLLMAILTFSVIGSGYARAEPPQGEAPSVWQDTNRSIDDRAADLLSRLTLEEKIGLVHANGSFNTAGLPRFGIKEFWASDGPQGVREEMEPNSFMSANRNDRFRHGTAGQYCLGCDVRSDHGAAVRDVLGKEARARGKHVLLAPGLNIMRTPLNGRNSEYFGEDPWLASRMGVEVVKAVQANGIKTGR